MTVTFDLTDPTVRKYAKLFWYGMAIRTTQAVSIGEDVVVTTPWGSIWKGKVVRILDAGRGVKSVFVEFDHMSAVRSASMLYLPSTHTDIKINARGFGSGSLRVPVQYGWWLSAGRDVIIGSGGKILFVGKIKDVVDKVSYLEVKVVDRIQYYGNNMVNIYLPANSKLTDLLVQVLRSIEELKDVGIQIMSSVQNSQANITFTEDVFVRGKVYEIVSVILEILNASIYDQVTTITILPTGGVSSGLDITSTNANIAEVKYSTDIINRAVVVGSKFTDLSNYDAITYGLAEEVSSGVFDWDTITTTDTATEHTSQLSYVIPVKSTAYQSRLDYMSMGAEYASSVALRMIPDTSTAISTSGSMLVMDGIKTVYVNLPIEVRVSGTTVSLEGIYYRTYEGNYSLGYEVVQTGGVSIYRTVVQIPFWQYISNGQIYYAVPQTIPLNIDLGTAGSYDVNISPVASSSQYLTISSNGLELGAVRYYGSGGDEAISITVHARPTLKTVQFLGYDHKPLVVYNWEDIEKVAVAEDNDSISQYGVQEAVFNLSNIDLTLDQLQAVADSIVSAYSKPTPIVTAIIPLVSVDSILGDGYVGYTYDVTDTRYGLQAETLTLTEIRIRDMEVQLTFASYQTDKYRYWTNIGRLFDMTTNPISIQYYNRI